MVENGFETVEAEFARCFEELGETGAGFCAYVDGRPVVDLRRGLEPDSLVHVYSVTKPAAAFCVLVLVDRGLIGLDVAVAEYWPEFAAGGKDLVTVRQLLSHQAGLAALRELQPPEVWFDWDRLCGLLAEETPWWTPGSGHGEHALFYGHLCGELVRRVDGRTLGQFWREKVAAPWGLDFHIGLGDEELARTVDLDGEIPTGVGELYALATANPPGLTDLELVNGEDWRRAEIPAVNGHATAEAVARFFAGLQAGGELDGVRLVEPAIVEEMATGQMTAPDQVIGGDTTWGLGVWIDLDGWGMGGLGGSLGMADPELGLAYGYVTKRMGTHDRAEAMDVAVREAAKRVRGERVAG